MCHHQTNFQPPTPRQGTRVNARAEPQQKRQRMSKRDAMKSVLGRNRTGFRGTDIFRGSGWAALVLLFIFTLASKFRVHWVRATRGQCGWWRCPGPHLDSINTSYSLAHQESGGFFDDIRETDWTMLKERMRRTPECSRQCEAEVPHAWYQNNWEPSFTCLHERRIGQWGDGGKWVCDPHRAAKAMQPKQGCLVYSIGSNNDFSFEEAVLSEVSPSCEIHVFDPTIGDQPVNLPQHGKIAFHPWGLSELDAGVYKTLATMQRDLGHEGREIDILKVDCEGCEWGTYMSWFDAGVLPPRQILVELHGGTDGASPVPAAQFMDFLKACGYVIFHKEPNTLGCMGYCIEYAFLRLGGPVDNNSS